MKDEGVDCSDWLHLLSVPARVLPLSFTLNPQAFILYYQVLLSFSLTFYGHQPTLHDKLRAIRLAPVRLICHDLAAG